MRASEIFPLLLGPGEDEGEEWKSSQRFESFSRGLRHMLPSLVWRVTEAAQKKTPLYDEHVRRGAKIVPFAGWLMPVQYTSIVEEHQSVRNNVGMFDISHMGQLIVDGAGAQEWLNTMLTNNIEKLDVDAGQYTFLLNERGGIIDDLIAYRIGQQKFLLVVNASRTDENVAWVEKHLRSGVKIDNRTANFGAVAIQGPRVTDLFQELPARNRIVDVAVEGMNVSIARTGYTGEDGVEVFFRASDAVKFWRLMIERGAKPCGLGARDTLRLEMCYPLNGSDLSPERNPLEAGLGLFVDLAKPHFIGRDVLLRTKENGER